MDIILKQSKDIGFLKFVSETMNKGVSEYLQGRHVLTQ